MRQSLKQKIIAVCEQKILSKGDNVGLSFYAFFAIGLAMYFASQGAGRMMVPFIGSVLRICVAFGGVLLLAQVTDWGVNGVFRSIAAGMLVYGGFITVALWRVRWG